MTSRINLLLIWVAIGIMGRLVIHIPDVTPLTSLCLLSSTIFPKRVSVAIIFITLILSDFLLQIIFKQSQFGIWSLFNYSGWFLVILIGFGFAKNPSFKNSIYFTVFSAFIFWLWSNLGTFCFSFGLYSHTLNGLMQCYIAALPFLRNAVLGSLVWTVVLIFCLKIPNLKTSIKSHA